MDNTFNKTYELGGPNDYTWKKIINIISNAYGKNKWTMPAPVIPIKILAYLFDSFKWFPITN